jgi:hypothetical protein
VLPEWSPVAAYGGYAKPAEAPVPVHSRSACTHVQHRPLPGTANGLGCLCWAF